MDDREIRLASTKLTEGKLDKSQATCNLCHTEIKARCMRIVGS